MATSYFEKLKDPRWQRKRLEVMGRAEFVCEVCDADDQTLNVHHGYYEKGRDPWDYPEWSLWCLCEQCHVEVQRRTATVQSLIASLGEPDMDRLFGYLVGLIATSSCSNLPCSEIPTMTNSEMVEGCCENLHLTEHAKYCAIYAGTRGHLSVGDIFNLFRELRAQDGVNGEGI